MTARRLEAKILYDPVAQQAVIVVDDRPVGCVFDSRKVHGVWISGKRAAEWLIFKLYAYGGLVLLINMSPEELVEAQNNTYLTLSEALDLALRCGLVDGKHTEGFVEAAFRGVLADYAKALVEISSKRGVTAAQAAIMLNAKLPEWGWHVPPVLHELAYAEEVTQ